MDFLKELEQFQEPIDPLVIVLNCNQFWIKDGLCCSADLEIDKNLFNESEVMNDSPYIYHKYKKLTPIIKYSKIDLK